MKSERKEKQRETKSEVKRKFEKRTKTEFLEDKEKT